MFNESCINETHIETRIVRHQYRRADELEQFRKHLFYWRRIVHHGVGNAREQHNVRRNCMARVNERVESRYFLATHILHCTNFRNATIFC